MKTTFKVVPVSRERRSSSSLAGEDRRTTLWLDEHGRIMDCSGLADGAFGYCPNELTGSHISKLLPALSNVDLLSGDAVNPRLAFKCRCGPFRVVERGGLESEGVLFINAISLPSGPALALIVVQPPAVRRVERRRTEALRSTFSVDRRAAS